MISFSSLNHLTDKGAVPVKVALKTTVLPGMTSWFSGFCLNTGGSGDHSQNTLAFHVSTKSYNKNRHKRSQAFITFDIERATGFLEAS